VSHSKYGERHITTVRFRRLPGHVPVQAREEQSGRRTCWCMARQKARCREVVVQVRGAARGGHDAMSFTYKRHTASGRSNADARSAPTGSA